MKHAIESLIGVKFNQYTGIAQSQYEYFSIEKSVLNIEYIDEDYIYTYDVNLPLHNKKGIITAFIRCILTKDS